MRFFLSAAIILGSWNPSKTQYTVNGRVCGFAGQGFMLVTFHGQPAFMPWYAVTFGSHKHPDIPFKSQAEAVAEVERECAADGTR